MKNNISKIIDNKLFVGVDQLKSTPQYNQVSAQLESVPEEYGKYINQLITYTISFFPLLILFVMAIYFMIAQSSISDKRELLKSLIETNSLSSEAIQYERSLVGRLNISELGDMKNILNRMVKQQGIDSNSISVESFDTQNIGTMKKSIATIKISTISTPDLISILRSLTVTEKFKIKSIDLNQKNNSISGKISLLHFGKPEVQ